LDSSIVVNSEFDGGNIICDSANSAADIQLRIAKDNNSEFMQWFYFEVSGGAGQQRTMHINNAGECAYVGGWEDYRACASYDRENWFRVDTECLFSALFNDEARCINFPHAR